MGSDANIPTRDLDDAGRKAERRRPAPRILLIDDDPTTRNIVSHFLRKEDLVVIKASRGSDGLEMARNDRPDLLIINVAVAGVNGLELLSLLERESGTRGLPVLLLSSLDDEDAIVKSLDAGADYVIKPFSPRVLVAKVKKILRETSDHAVDRRPL
jgi:DNA-binding response OmpR family regulator